MDEKEIQNKILDYLNRRGDIFAWSNSSTGLYDPIKKCFRKRSGFNIKSVSDILGITNKGVLLAIEVKTEEGIKKTIGPIVGQRVFLDKIKRMGGIAIMATSIEEVARIIDEK